MERGKGKGLGRFESRTPFDVAGGQESVFGRGDVSVGRQFGRCRDEVVMR